MSLFTTREITTVSNYSELTQSVGGINPNEEANDIISFQLFRINPIGGVFEVCQNPDIAKCFQLFRINPIGGVIC